MIHNHLGKRVIDVALNHSGVQIRSWQYRIIPNAHMRAASGLIGFLYSPDRVIFSTAYYKKCLHIGLPVHVVLAPRHHNIKRVNRYLLRSGH